MHSLLKYLVIGSLAAVPAGLATKHYMHKEPPKAEQVLPKPKPKVEEKKKVVKKKMVVRKPIQQPQPKKEWWNEGRW